MIFSISDFSILAIFDKSRKGLSLSLLMSYMTSLNKKGKEDFSILIDDVYGSQEVLAKILDLGIEMLFYLEEDTFERKEVQQVVSALRGIAHLLRQ